MNYVLAPLFLLNLPTRDAIYALYVQFIQKLQAALFSDNDFGSLQCTFLLFKLSLQYHDPELALFLDHHDMGQCVMGPARQLQRARPLLT